MSSYNEAQARIKARIWQAVAQSDQTNDIPKTSLEALVDMVTEAALLEVDVLLDESVHEVTPETAVESGPTYDPSDDEETVLWEGRPFLSMTLHYTLTDERVRISEGLFGKTRDDIELVRIQDIDYKQNLTERMLKLGDLTIRSHDPKHPIVVLNNVKNPEEVHELMRRAVLKARKKHRLSYREEM